MRVQKKVKRSVALVLACLLLSSGNVFAMAEDSSERAQDAAALDQNSDAVANELEAEVQGELTESVATEDAQVQDEIEAAEEAEETELQDEVVATEEIAAMEEIVAAEAITASGTIVFDADTILTEPIVISGDTTIKAAENVGAVTLTTGGSFRHVIVTGDNVTLTFEGVVLDGDYVGGGICGNGDSIISISNSTIDGNSARYGGGEPFPVR